MVRPLTAERRAHSRLPLSSRLVITATLRPGCVIALCNVSRDGALVRSPRPIRPGSRVQLQVLCREQRLSVAATVVRCTVAALHPLEGPSYAAALKFDHEVEWMW